MRAEMFVLFSEECLVDSRLPVNICCRKGQGNELTDVNPHCYLQGYGKVSLTAMGLNLPSNSGKAHLEGHLNYL